MCHDEGKAKSLNANGGKASPQVTSKGSGLGAKFICINLALIKISCSLLNSARAAELKN